MSKQMQNTSSMKPNRKSRNSQEISSSLSDDTPKKREVFLFFGAGASAAGGYKTFLTFPYMFWRSPDSDGELQTNQKTYKLLEQIRDQLQRKNKALTLDQYLEMLDNYKRTLRNMFSDNQLREVINQSRLSFSKAQNLNNTIERLRTNICSLTAYHYMAPPNEIDYLKRLRTFVNSLFINDKSTHVYIFTTNYDLVPEYAFSDNLDLQQYANKYWQSANLNEGNVWDNGCFKSKNELYKFYNGFSNFRNAKLGIKTPCKDIFVDESIAGERIYWDSKSYKQGMESNENALFIMRLHGCVAWIYNDSKAIQPGKDNKVCFNLSNPVNIKRHFERLCVFYPGKETPIGKQPHALSFQIMSDLALKLRTITFVGYAFRDIDVVSVIMNSLRDSLSIDKALKKEIILVNPAMTVDDFYNSLAIIQNSIATPMYKGDSDLFDSVRTKSLNMYFLNTDASTGTLIGKIKQTIGE
ncbi:hypothetical protein [Dethiosulfatarculus sandiegensis]|uniref:SIR2-like domain-containing protein n=1 Tax=Dethiosulfatarculus sandiegensis TaxID=1429043 RepID=A0A0D2J9W9_9BACT|nr:hypothetical protein [Dethiosulfatarculus sandiegensis]KIX12466.1 hypothetical protein X474_19230 [Dethiosulfatarculus sandiegensis]